MAMLMIVSILERKQIKVLITEVHYGTTQLSFNYLRNRTMITYSQTKIHSDTFNISHIITV